MAGNWRVAIAFAFIGAMVVALVLLLLPDEDDPVAATTSLPSTTTTSSPATTTSTTIAEATTTSVQPGDRLAEVERILEELTIAWYDAVYRKDESGLADVVATRLLYEAAIGAMDSMQFLGAPSHETLNVEVKEILLDRDDCLAVYRNMDVSRTLVEATPDSAVTILWPRADGSYRIASLWSSPQDLWLDDCDLMDRTEIP